MTEQVGYNGPIYMTTPTKAISKLLIEDMRRILDEKETEKDLFTSQMIDDCFNKVSEITLHETVEINGIKIKAYYAGHVLGAAMFHIQVGCYSVVYTGDYNMTSDSHLGGAWIDRCHPDIIITESTYATTIRESRRSRENDMLSKIHQIVSKGGKVLIPVFALGRAQEICLLLERYWESKNLTVPIYMSTGMAEKAVNYYKLFIGWTNQTMKESFYKRNLFHFKRTLPFDRSYVDHPGPMVVLASPGMLHAGMSCFVFKKWATDAANALLLPGYCAVGTLGHKILTGQTQIESDDDPNYFLEVKLQILNMSFSAHADSNGIMQLIDYCRPKTAVVLVHGEVEGMKVITEAIKNEFGLDCYHPANGEMLNIVVENPPIEALIPMNCISRIKAASGHRFHGTLMFQDHPKYPVRISNAELQLDGEKSVIFSTDIKLTTPSNDVLKINSIQSILQNIETRITNTLPSTVLTYIDAISFFIHSFQLSISTNIEEKCFFAHIKWNSFDNDIAEDLIRIIQSWNTNPIVENSN